MDGRVWVHDRTCLSAWSLRVADVSNVYMYSADSIGPLATQTSGYAQETEDVTPWAGCDPRHPFAPSESYRAVSLEELATLAPFTVWVPSATPAESSVRAHWYARSESSVARAVLFYTSSDRREQLVLSQSDEDELAHGQGWARVTLPDGSPVAVRECGPHQQLEGRFGRTYLEMHTSHGTIGRLLEFARSLRRREPGWPC